MDARDHGTYHRQCQRLYAPIVILDDKFPMGPSANEYPDRRTNGLYIRAAVVLSGF